MLKVAALLLAVLVGAAVVSAQAAVELAPEKASPQPSQQPQPATAKRCRADVLGLLVSLGWAYATKRHVSIEPPHPCPDNVQEPQQPAPQKEPKRAPSSNRLSDLPAGEALREARVLFIRPRSAWFNSGKLERELLKRKEFSEMGLEITRSANNADLVLEVTRKVFTTRFTCSIIEPSSERVLAATTASSLGGEIEPHLADAILKQFKAARSKPASEQRADEKKPE